MAPRGAGSASRLDSCCVCVRLGTNRPSLRVDRILPNMRTVAAGLVLLLQALTTAVAQVSQQEDCYMRLERDGEPCNDGNPATVTDECYQGACGSWITVDTTIQSEEQRLQFAADAGIADTGCTECTADSFPYYLALSVSDHGAGATAQTGHGAGAAEAAVYAWMHFQQPDTFFTAWRAGTDAGDMRGRSTIAPNTEAWLVVLLVAQRESGVGAEPLLIPCAHRSQGAVHQQSWHLCKW